MNRWSSLAALVALQALLAGARRLGEGEDGAALRLAWAREVEAANAAEELAEGNVPARIYVPAAVASTSRAAVRGVSLGGAGGAPVLFQPTPLSQPVTLLVRKRRSKRPTLRPTGSSGAPSVAAPTATPAPTRAGAPRPHLLVFLTDDLGFHDVGYADQPRAASVLATPNLMQLAREGVRLDRHYAHWHCSPTRRSFLSGRLPHRAGGGNLTDYVDDDMDVRFTWLSEKLASAGYRGLYYGKGHTGFRSLNMMPSHRGFEDFSGFLLGTQKYTSTDRWRMDSYSGVGTFSTALYGDAIVEKVGALLARPEERVFLLASWQTPHQPLATPPATRYPKLSAAWNLLDWNMYALDVEVGRVLALMRRNATVWNNTVVLFFSDNGGTSKNSFGNNWPLRGEKGTAFEGGFRSTAVLGGGLVPPRVRGTSSNLVSHVSDWYRTFCNLAGVDADDAPPVPPKHAGLTGADVASPSYPYVVNAQNGSHENVWGENSFPNIDSVDLWPALTSGQPLAIDALHPTLVLSEEAILAGDYKLILAQPCSKGIAGEIPCKTDVQYGWVSQNSASVWTAPPSAEVGKGCMRVFDDRLGPQAYTFTPCLYNLAQDKRETTQVNDPAKIARLWKAFNDSMVYQYSPHIVGKERGVSPPACHGTCRTPLQIAAFFGISATVAAPQCALDLVGKFAAKTSC
jgi:arylsulfatase B